MLPRRCQLLSGKLSEGKLSEGKLSGGKLSEGLLLQQNRAFTIVDRSGVTETLIYLKSFPVLPPSPFLGLPEDYPQTVRIAADAAKYASPTAFRFQKL